MEESQYLDLIQRELDEENTAQQSAELQALMTEHPSIRKAYEELRTVVTTMEQAEMQQPPTHLKGTIMAALPRQQKATALAKSWRSMLAGLLPHQPRFQIGFAFAGGLALGAMLFALLSPETFVRQPDPAQLYGTLASSSQSDQPISVEIGDTHGTVEVRTSENDITVALDFGANEAVDLLLEFEPERLRFGAMISDGVAPENIHFASGTLILRPRNGIKSRISFINLKNSAPQLVFKITENGEVRYQTSLPKTQ